MEGKTDREGLFGLGKTDPEFVRIFERFAFGDVVRRSRLDDRTRFLAVLAALIGCQGADAYERMLSMALDGGVSPVEAKEVVYQAAAYLGIGRVLPFLYRTNSVLEARKEKLPLPGQAAELQDGRRAAGERKQVEIFGEGMRGFAQSGPEETRHINEWLSENCFGDYYTRGSLGNAQREMITFCFLFAQGGCEPQLISHAKANLRIGNDKAFLIDVVSQCLPYVGYPRALNALRCVQEASQE